MTPTGPREVVGRLWSAASVMSTASAAAAYRTVFTTVLPLVLGRPVTIRHRDRDFRLTVTDVDTAFDLRAMALGRFGDVRIEAADVSWAGGRLERVTVVLRDVALRPGIPPMLTAAPVQWSARLDSSVVEEALGVVVPRMAGGVDDDGIAWLRWARRPHWAGVRLAAEVDDTDLVLRPEALQLGRRGVTLPGRTPAYRIRLPVLSDGLRLTGVEFAAGGLALRGDLPRWRARVPRNRLEDFVSQLTGRR